MPAAIKIYIANCADKANFYCANNAIAQQL